MIGQQLLELLAAILACLIRVMEQAFAWSGADLVTLPAMAAFVGVHGGAGGRAHLRACAAGPSGP